MSHAYQQVEIVVVLVYDESSNRLLADYNHRWEAFTLPMTKGHEIPSAIENGPPTMETPLSAAIRAAVEVLGRPLSPFQLPEPMNIEIPMWEQSGRDGQWKRYHCLPFAMQAYFEPQPLPGHSAIWLTPAEFLTHEPVSPTARRILQAIPVAELRMVLGV